MRAGFLVRAFALAVVLSIIACCSSLSTVVAFNDSTRPMDLKVSAPHGEGWAGRLAPGESVEVWSGFRGPGTMTFVVDGKTIKYDEAALGGFARAGSAGAEVNWRWQGQSGVFEVATRNKVSQWMNQMLALGCLIVIGFAIAVRWMVLTLQRHAADAARNRPSR